jgi:hypothetical protein
MVPCWRWMTLSPHAFTGELNGVGQPRDIHLAQSDLSEVLDALAPAAAGDLPYSAGISEWTILRSSPWERR